MVNLYNGYITMVLLQLLNGCMVPLTSCLTVVLTWRNTAALSSWITATSLPHGARPAFQFAGFPKFVLDNHRLYAQSTRPREVPCTHNWKITSILQWNFLRAVVNFVLVLFFKFDKQVTMLIKLESGWYKLKNLCPIPIIYLISV